MNRETGDYALVYNELRGPKPWFLSFMLKIM